MKQVARVAIAVHEAFAQCETRYELQSRRRRRRGMNRWRIRVLHRSLDGQYSRATRISCHHQLLFLSKIMVGKNSTREMLLCFTLEFATSFLVVLLNSGDWISALLTSHPIPTSQSRVFTGDGRDGHRVDMMESVREISPPDSLPIGVA